LNEAYIVSARKYRPDSFSTVVGQPTVVQTLQNSLRTGKIAQAYLFCGPRGVGKTSTARIFAKTLNCSNLDGDYNPCNQCPSCIEFQENRSFNIYELDAASHNSVEDIRHLIEMVQVPPQNGRYKVFIIDEVHMLSVAAFNAFLKTLEEPPSYAIFILATTEKHKILPTILSRCQVMDFKRMQIPDIIEHLKKIAQKEQVEFEDDALHLIAQKADGAMRDALSIFDMLVNSTDGKLTYNEVIKHLNVIETRIFGKIADAILNQQPGEIFLLLDELIKNGFDLSYFLAGMAEHFRNLLIMKFPAAVNVLEATEESKMIYREQAPKFDVEFLQYAFHHFEEAELKIRTAGNPRLWAEASIMRLFQLYTKKNSGQHDENNINLSNNKSVQQAQTSPSGTSKEPDQQYNDKSGITNRSATKPDGQTRNSLEETGETQNVSSISPAKSQNQEKSTAKSGKQVKRSLFSVNKTQTIEPKPDENKPAINNDIIEPLPVDQEKLYQCLPELANKFDHSPVLRVMFKKEFCRVEGNKVIFGAINPSQIEAFESHRLEIGRWLADHLQNSTLLIDVEKTEVPETVKTLTKDEIIKQWSEENPHLEDLINRLELKIR
jgi:DNA polymerase-3 subunit gamma/tau